MLAYILRRAGNGEELLVFDHVAVPEAGTQVPAGTVESAESLEEAVLREVREESGLTGLIVDHCVGRFLYESADPPERHERNVYVLRLSQPVPETWLHRVFGHGQDTGLEFRYYWVDAKAAVHLLAGHQGDYLAHRLK